MKRIGAAVAAIALVGSLAACDTRTNRLKACTAKTGSYSEDTRSDRFTCVLPGGETVTP